MPFQMIFLADNADEQIANMSPFLFQLACGVIIVMMVVMSRKQKKKDKEIQDMIDNIQIGDEIVTAGGIVGIVLKKSEDTVVLETGTDRNKIRVKKWAIRDNVTALEQKEKEEAAAKPSLNKEKS